MNITIEKNIPVPGEPKRGRPALYPFKHMKKGDSFAVPLSGKKVKAGGGRKAPAEAMRVSRAAYSFKHRHGGDFTVRVIADEGIVRVWKIAA